MDAKEPPKAMTWFFSCGTTITICMNPGARVNPDEMSVFVAAIRGLVRVTATQEPGKTGEA